MILRDAAPTDAAMICAFWNPAIRDTVITFNSVQKTQAEVAQMIAARPFFHVVELNGQVQGFVTYDQFRGGVGYRHTVEHTIVLAPAAQGQGAGCALMEVAVAHARAAAVHSLIAGVSGENAAGVAFHAAMGFETVATLPEVGRKFDRWMDLVLMQKRL